MKIDALNDEFIKVGNHGGDGAEDRFYIDQHAIGGKEPDGEIRLSREQLRELRGWIDKEIPRDATRAAAPQPCEPETAEDPALPRATSDADKLRILAAVIDAQAPFGTDLADFKRRLQIVLGA